MVQGKNFRNLRLLFVNKKKQKNFDYFPAEAVAAPMPMPQHNKSFLLLFFKKEVLGLT
jgi:hypothetical protein